VHDLKAIRLVVPDRCANTKRADPEGPLSEVEMIMSIEILGDRDAPGKRIVAN
jgi:hypothetical protein